MAIAIAINDTMAKCCGKPFKRCTIVFRKDKQSGTFKTSELINPKFVQSKTEVICYCDGVTSKEEVAPLPIIEEEQLPIEQEKMFPNCTPCQCMERKEEMELHYQTDKIIWAERHGDKRLNLAIKYGYPCDEEYCIERLKLELPEFRLVDSQTFFWRNSYPSLAALEIEKALKTCINGSKCKFGTYIRICKIEDTDEEAIVIINYLGQFEIIAPVKDLLERVLNEPEFIKQCNGFSLLSD